MSKNRIVDKVCYDHKIDYDIAVKNEQSSYTHQHGSCKPTMEGRKKNVYCLMA